MRFGEPWRGHWPQSLQLCPLMFAIRSTFFCLFCFIFFSWGPLLLARSEWRRSNTSCGSPLGASALSKVWMEEFEHKLRIRFFSHHTKCGQCIRHKLLLKRLGGCPPAKRAQRALLMAHLARQHRDRQVYWNLRSECRLYIYASTTGWKFCGILDSMDQQKYCFPRWSVMQGKDFSKMNRPRMSGTCLLLHGHAAHTSNSSRTMEILAAALTSLYRSITNDAHQRNNKTNTHQLKMFVPSSRLLVPWSLGRMVPRSLGWSPVLLVLHRSFGHVRRKINNVLSIHLVAYVCEPKTAAFAVFCALFLAWLLFPAVSHSFLAFLLVFLWFFDTRPKC